MSHNLPILNLGNEFYDEVEAALFSTPILRYKNVKWATRLGLHLSDTDWLKHFGQFQPLPENLQKPLALRYHGHQFMNYNPQIGDGRGFLYAQVNVQGKAYDLGTKGSGTTPYSRRGDGRLTLKGAVRELLATTYLEAQRVNTSKTFSVIETGEALQRNDEPSPTRSAVLVRLNHGHIRIGTFQRLAYLDQPENLKKLLYYSLETYYPLLKPSSDLKSDIKLFLQAVAGECAKTCAEWMMAGFVHGVLNTDNINITGESFDYGPYRFLPYYDPMFTAAYFDHEKLYAYGKQPQVIYWNLQQLLLSFTILDIEKEELVDAISSYSKKFSDHLIALFLQRLNLSPTNQVENNKLFSATFTFLEESKCPFEDFFFDWFSYEKRGFKALTGERKEYYKGEAFNSFYSLLKGFKDIENQKASDPYFEGASAENLYIDEIERIWSEIASHDNWQPLYEKLARIEKMRTY
jgi:uncharacterized protein YdiU (UPF0061 family)